MTASDFERPYRLEDLLRVMKRLRDPENGCPWDVEQTFRTIAPFTVEEAYEVADAIERDDLGGLKEELGDLLFQVVFHAQIAEEEGQFAFNNVVEAITDKMIRRHPHVFAASGDRTAEEQTAAWEAQKARERADKGLDGLLDDVPAALPGLSRAIKLQRRAARVGFDWANAKDILSKVAEEAGEVVDAADAKSPEAVEEEFGDLLFVMANLARRLDVDPEASLRRANEKFIRRFRHIEAGVAAKGAALSEASLDEMEALWEEAKLAEKETPSGTEKQ
ncbi:MAG: nucleoside triphosphate pyrophosphohydrolase [Pseudomonadota bacterium]